MEAKLAAVFSGSLGGVRVAELCVQLGISRQTFYKYRRRFLAEGPAGLVERSRRPHRSPAMIAAELEDEIVRLRKSLPLDVGAQTIAYHLERSGWPVPSVATIHRALRRRGLVVDQPQKRPRSSWTRFEWPRPNDAWQIDATRWVLMSGTEISSGGSPSTPPADTKAPANPPAGNPEPPNPTTPNVSHVPRDVSAMSRDITCPVGVLKGT